MTATVLALTDRPQTRAAKGRVGIIGAAPVLAKAVADIADVHWQLTAIDHVDDAWERAERAPVETVAYVPRLVSGPDLRPDLAHARAALTACRHAGTHHVVLLSSTAIYGASPRHGGLAVERLTAPAGQAIAGAWRDLEGIAAEAMGAAHVTVLRAAPTPVAGEPDIFSRMLGAGWATTILGHDPTLQLLSVGDLARAIATAVQSRRPGIFNIVPTAAIPLHAALRAAGTRAVPIPWSLHCAFRAITRGAFGTATADQMQYLRYHLTAAPDAAARGLGFVAHDSSADAVPPTRREPPTEAAPRGVAFDPFGLDRAYIERCHRGFMGFLHRRYWRIETRGLERLPRRGGGVLVGMHRGFMPFDGVMTLLSVVAGIGRVPRFLIHPGVGLRFPFLFNLMSKLGGVIACRENGDRVLASGELLAVYPEGIRGAFTVYKYAHRIGPSWRNDCVAFAIRHGVPIVPFVTIGSAEIFPIFGRIDWAWWKRYTEWPFIPITPTFPFVPLPLPSKWHTLFLEPLDVARDYPADAADDPVVVRAVADQVKRRMEAAVAELTARRRSIFFGSLFPPESA